MPELNTGLGFHGEERGGEKADVCGEWLMASIASLQAGMGLRQGGAGSRFHRGVCCMLMRRALEVRFGMPVGA